MRLSLIILTLLLLRPAVAHEVETIADPFDRMARYGALLERIAQLEIQAGSNEASPALPYIKIGRKRFYLDSGFFQLTEDIARIYYDDLQRICADCRLPAPEEIRRSSEELVARGWLSETAGRLGHAVAFRYGSQFIDLGARYGTAAGLLKVAGELAEDALLVVFKLPGAHFLCEVITLGISYYSGNFLTFYRTLKSAGRFGASPSLQLVRLAATRWAVRRSFERVRLFMAPIEFDERLHLEGAPLNARQEWLHHELDEDRRFERFLRALQTKMEKAAQRLELLRAQQPAPDSLAFERWQSRFVELEEKLSQSEKIYRKVFEGRRLGWTFYLFRRNRRHTLASSELDLNRFYRGTSLWVVPLTTTILEPGLVNSRETNGTLSALQRLREQRGSRLNAQSSVDQFLLQESIDKGISPERMRTLFTDLNSVFDPRTSRSDRLAHVYVMEGFLSGFLPSLMRQQLDLLRTERGPHPESRWLDVKLWTQIQWANGQFAYLVNMYVDLLRTVSILPQGSSRQQDLEFSKDYLIEIIKGVDHIGRLGSVKSVEDLQSEARRFSEQIRLLKAKRFWLEKRAGHKLLPIGETLNSLIRLFPRNSFRKRVACQKLYF